ncbi:suppressor APC domain-containing protein 2 [Vipera latastei]
MAGRGGRRGAERWRGPDPPRALAKRPLGCWARPRSRPVRAGGPGGSGEPRPPLPAAKSNRRARRRGQWASGAGAGGQSAGRAADVTGSPLRRRRVAMAPERASSGLPAAFLRSLRPLYDILDERRRGRVHLREIESRWLQPGGEAGPLPPGVLEGLRRAAPPSGYLTFERFVLGLRLALLGPGNGALGRAAAPLGAWSGAATAGGRSSRGRKQVGEERSEGAGSLWAVGFPRNTPTPSVLTWDTLPLRLPPAAGEPAEQLGSEGPCVEPRRHPSIRGERRRHTIAHGVDCEMLKQMKELEKDKNFLLQGLELVEEARSWYHHQLHRLQGRQKQLARSKGCQDEGSRVQLSQLFPHVQELNRCLWQLFSVSAEPGNASPPTASHSPPATLLGPSLYAGPQQTINMLKEQNRLLTKEVTDKGHRITQLEQEKSALIKQLFGARAESTKDSDQLDSTFI